LLNVLGVAHHNDRFVGVKRIAAIASTPNAAEEFNMALKSFKTYDIRGRAPDELDDDVAERIGCAYAAVVGAGASSLGTTSVRRALRSLQR
jgi:phosphomannomutase